MEIRQFILTRDRAEARRIRRMIAESGCGFNVQVGTWLELVQTAVDAYLLSSSTDNWQEQLLATLPDQQNSFWSKSFAVAQEQTAAIIVSELDRLIRSLSPGQDIGSITPADLPARAKRHLAELNQLHLSIDQQLPADLEAVTKIINADIADSVRLINVKVMDELTNLNPWQQALIDKLNSDSAAQYAPTTDHIMDIITPQKTVKSTALTTLQQQLYRHQPTPTKLDNSIQWLAVRDYLEEVEIVAGMIQKSLVTDNSLSCSDIAVLLPDDPCYSAALGDIFTQAGLPVAGLVVKQQQRDLGHEIIFYLLQTLRKPAPIMAMTAFVTSPLLPWARAQGFAIAAALMNGNYQLKKVHLPVIKSSEYILNLIRYGVDSAGDLQAILTKFPALLNTDEQLSRYHAQVVTLCDQLTAQLDGDNGNDIPWETLLAMAAPGSNSVEITDEFSREGIGVFYEHQEPWRQVKTLYVLGFNCGHYPRESKTSPVFSDDDITILQAQGLHFAGAVDVGNKRRTLFCRQLRAVDNEIHFLLSRRDGCGKPLSPSSTLPFMAQLFTLGKEPEALIYELDTARGRDCARGIALAPQLQPLAARQLEIADLQFEHNLLEVFTDDNGKPRKQSPSSLETLMTSPLAWLLGRSGLEPQEWEPEKLDVMSKGTLAHAVFEALFAPGCSLPSEDQVEQLVPTLLYEKIVAIVPFLNRPEWRVERYHLQREVLTAALRWREVLDAIGAKILGVEVWLHGKIDQQPIHGSADLLMELGDGKIYVVDYKKSSSKKRKERMQKGYDSQASLYRIMLQSGEGNFRSSDNTTVTIDSEREIGALYYLMNDQVALADTDNWIVASLRDFEELGADVAANALPLIRERLTQVKHGQIKLNSDGDEQWYEKNAGIVLYGLDNSPLIRMFMHQGQ